MVKYFLLVLIMSFLCVSSNGQSLQTEQRNLDNYEKIIISVPMSTNPSSSVAKVKDFVWEHWKRQSQGYAEITLYNKEGEPNRSYYFIEPDKMSVWRVVIQVVSEKHDRRPISDPERSGEVKVQTRNYEAFVVEQINISKDKRAPRVKNQKNSYLLRFIDKNGKILFNE